MSLHILSNANVRSLLGELDTHTLDGLCTTLSTAFQAYSIEGEKAYQCHRQGVTRPGAATMLFMPATLRGCASVKVVGVPPPTPAASNKVGSSAASPPKPISGVVLICAEDGKAMGVLNAAELTAFRTSLGSILLYRLRKVTRDVVVFGAGKQAFWHLRLALQLRRNDTSTVTIVNRSISRAQGLMGALRAMEWGPSALDHISFSILQPTDSIRVKSAVQQADVIFCTTPSTEPVFPADWLTAEAARDKPRFLSAIGSYKLDMQEIDPKLLRAVIADSGHPHCYHPNGHKGGAILVDSRDACAVEAGELVKAEVPDTHLVETGELLQMLQLADEAKKNELESWLSAGNVIYKSVGIGIMDLCIGRALLELGASLSIGTTVDDF